MRQKFEKLLVAIRNCIRDRKRLIGLLSCLVLLYLFIVAASAVTPMVKVFELTLVFMLIGITPAYLLRKVFLFRNIVGWLTNASVIGIIFTPLLFLLFGWLNFNFIFVHSINILRALAVVSVLTLFVLLKKEEIQELISFDGLSIIDYFFYLVIFVFSV